MVLEFPLQAPFLDILDDVQELLAAFGERVLTFDGHCRVVRGLLDEALFLEFFQPLGERFRSYVLQFGLELIEAFLLPLALVEFKKDAERPFLSDYINCFVDGTVFHGIQLETTSYICPRHNIQ